MFKTILISILLFVSTVSAQWGGWGAGANAPSSNTVSPETYPSWTSSSFTSGTTPYCPPTDLDYGEAFSAPRCTDTGIIRTLGIEIEYDSSTWEFVLDSIWVSIRQNSDGCRYMGTPLVTGTITPVDSFPLSAFVLAPGDPLYYDRYDNFYTSILQDTTIAGTRYRSYRTNLFIPFRNGFTIWVTNWASQPIQFTASVECEYGDLPDFGAMNYFHIDYVKHDFASQALRNELVPLTTISGMGKGAFLASCFYGVMAAGAQEHRFLGFIDRNIPIAICSSWTEGATDTCYVYAGGFDDWEFDYPHPFMEKRYSPYLFITDQGAGDSSEYCLLNSDRREDNASRIKGWHKDENYFVVVARATHQDGDTIYAVPEAEATTVSMNHMVPDAASNSSRFSSSIYGCAKVRGSTSTAVQSWVKIWRPAILFDSEFNFYALSASANAAAFTGRFILWSWTEESNAVTVIDSNRYVDIHDSLKLPSAENIVLEFRAKWPSGYWTGINTAGDVTTPWCNLRGTEIRGFGCDGKYDSAYYFAQNGVLANFTGADSLSWQGVEGDIDDRPRLNMCENGASDPSITISSVVDRNGHLRNAFAGDYTIALGIMRISGTAQGGSSSPYLVRSGTLYLAFDDDPDTDNKIGFRGAATAKWLLPGCIGDLMPTGEWTTIGIINDSSANTLKVWHNAVQETVFTSVDMDTLVDVALIIAHNNSGWKSSLKDVVIWNAAIDSLEMLRVDSLLRIRY